MGSVNSNRSNKDFRYIFKSKHGSFVVIIPTRGDYAFKSNSTGSLRNAIGIRNRVGARIWGYYWDAVIAGFVDTIKSETASVHIREKSGSYVVQWRDLVTNTQMCKSFSINKYGENEAINLAKQMQGMVATKRMDQLKGWKRKDIRLKR